MLADPTGAFTKVTLNTVFSVFKFGLFFECVLVSVFLSAFQAVDLLLDSDQIVQVLGNKRSKR